MSAHWAVYDNGRGFHEVYVVDEHGCLLNTEPACSIPERYGEWFRGWLLQQPCPYPTTPELLEHMPTFAAPHSGAMSTD